MTDEELKLVPFERLWAEIASRNESAVLVFSRHIDPGDPIIDFCFRGGGCAALGLLEAAKSQLLSEIWSSDS